MDRRNFMKVVGGVLAGVAFVPKAKPQLTVAMLQKVKKELTDKEISRMCNTMEPTAIPNMTMGTSSNNYGVWINVRSYGADPKGRVDSTKAIQAAISRANQCEGKVYFPRGAYIIKSNIIV